MCVLCNIKYILSRVSEICSGNENEERRADDRTTDVRGDDITRRPNFVGRGIKKENIFSKIGYTLVVLNYEHST